MTKPTIYFAGKIEHDDWRFAITRTWNSSDDCNPDAKWDCGAFYYGGPFFISKNHGMDEHASQSRRREIWGTNLTLIRRADLVFAYIDCTSCYGTLIELGAASENHKIIGVAFGPDLSKSDRQNLWMAGECASRRYDMSLEPAWHHFATEFLPLYRPPWSSPTPSVLLLDDFMRRRRSRPS